VGTDVDIRPTPSSGVVHSLAQDAAAARELARFVREQSLSQTIQGREYLTAEAWSAAGRLLGLRIVCDEPKAFTGMEGAGGYSCRAHLYDANGVQIAEAGAICLRGEKRWMHADEFQIYSMAQTRASGKAHRMALSALAKLAGFEAAPVEEMDVDIATKQPGEGMADSTEPMPDPIVGRAERKRIDEAREAASLTAAEVRDVMQRMFNVPNSQMLRMSQVEPLIAEIQAKGMNDIPEDVPAEQTELLGDDAA
jgi:hypothetical protein